MVKNLPASTGDAGDVGSVPGVGRSLGEGHGYPLQYSCLENPMDRGAWWTTVYGVAKSQTQLSNRPCIYAWLLPFKMEIEQLGLWLPPSLEKSCCLPSSLFQSDAHPS